MKMLWASITFLVASFVALTVMAPSAHAGSSGFYFEPGIVYAFKGDGKIGAANPVTGTPDISGDQSGPGAELRLGAHIHKIFFAGIEGLYLRDHFKTDPISAQGNEFTVGAFAGVQVPWIWKWFGGLRLWASYLPWAQVDYERNSGYQPKFIDGRGWKVGAGIRLSVVSLNFEYMKLSYHGSDISYTGGNTTYQTGDPRYDHDAYMVGVSFPLAL